MLSAVLSEAKGQERSISPDSDEKFPAIALHKRERDRLSWSRGDFFRNGGALPLTCPDFLGILFLLWENVCAYKVVQRIKGDRSFFPSSNPHAIALSIGSMSVLHKMLL